MTKVILAPVFSASSPRLEPRQAIRRIWPLVAQPDSVPAASSASFSLEDIAGIVRAIAIVNVQLLASLHGTRKSVQPGIPTVAASKDRLTVTSFVVLLLCGGEI